MKKINAAYPIVIVLFSVMVTFISVYMGISIYNSNSKAIVSDIVNVEIKDLTVYIKYNLELGKTVNNYYSLNDVLLDFDRKSDNVDEIYITDGQGGLIACSAGSGETVPEYALYMTEGYQNGPEGFFTVVSLTDGLYLVARVNPGTVRSFRGDASGKMAELATTGCAIIITVIIVMFILIRDTSLARKCGVVVLSIWIFMLGVYVSQANYNAYRESILRIESSIVEQYNNDLAELEKRGVGYEFIGGTESYLNRYIEDIDEIATLTEHNKVIDFVVSRTYMNRVIMGYLIQTLLIFFFSMIMLAEFNIFITDNLSKGVKRGPEPD